LTRRFEVHKTESGGFADRPPSFLHLSSSVVALLKVAEIGNNQANAGFKDPGVTAKVCLVTGSNTGIGKETALGLAKLGAHVVMVCRDPRRGEAAQSEIKQQTAGSRVDLMICDFSSQNSIRQFANAFMERYPRLDVLVNNAGVVLRQRSMTEDGLESTFAINHLGYFLVTMLLLDVLRITAPSRIVNVSSAAHKFGKPEITAWPTGRDYSAFGAYANSKLANVLFTYELARRLEGTGVTANCLHPGGVGTNLFRGLPRFLQALIKLVTISPERGARTSIYLASSPDVEGVTGKYFARRKQETSSAASYDEDAARALWDLSAELTGLNY
jgi:NAD(P)-dependent dehydrogenase (short-subunit alcohol dehydrogenase family)